MDCHEFLHHLRVEHYKRSGGRIEVLVPKDRKERVLGDLRDFGCRVLESQPHHSGGLRLEVALNPAPKGIREAVAKIEAIARIADENMDTLLKLMETRKSPEEQIRLAKEIHGRMKDRNEKVRKLKEAIKQKFPKPWRPGDR